MGYSGSASDAEGRTTAFHTVFIDSNLDTHLATIVSDVDTVSDFRRKIQFEHHQCFPDIGEIKIDALKVKIDGYFYHLTDSMPVQSAFRGYGDAWFLHLDASSHTKRIELCSDPALNNSDDRNNLVHGDISQRMLIHNNSSLVHEGSNHQVRPEILYVRKNGPQAFYSGVNDLGMESDPNGSHDKSMGILNKNGIGGFFDARLGNSLDKVLNSVSVGEKQKKVKDKRKNKQRNASSSRDTPEPEMTVPKKSSDNESQGISVKQKSIQVADSRSSPSKNRKRRHSEMPKESVLSLKTSLNKNGETHSVIGDLQYNNLVETSLSGHPTKKKRKIVVEYDNDSFAEQDHSLVGLEINEKDAGNMEKSVGTSKPKKASAVKTSKNSQKHDVSAECLSTPTRKDLDNLKNVVLSGSCESLNPGETEKNVGEVNAPKVLKEREKNEIDVGNMESSLGVSKPKKVSAVKKSRNSNKLDIGAEGLTSPPSKKLDNLDKDVTISAQTDIIVKEGGLPQNQKVVSSSPVEAEMDAGDVNAKKLVMEREENKHDIGVVECRLGASELKNASTRKKSRKSKRCDVSAEGLPTLASKDPETLVKDTVPSVQTDKTVDEKDLPQGQNIVLPVRCEPLSMGKTEKNVGEVNTDKLVDKREQQQHPKIVSSARCGSVSPVETANTAGRVSVLSKVNGASEERDPSSKQIKRSVKKTVARKVAKTGIEHIELPQTSMVDCLSLTKPNKTFVAGSSAELNNTSDVYPSEVEAWKEKNNFAQPEKREVIEATNTSLLIAEREAVTASEIEVQEALQVTQVSKLKVDAENMDKDLIKNKSEKHQDSAKGALPGLPMNVHDALCKDHVHFNHKTKKSKGTKKTVPDKTSPITNSKQEQPDNGAGIKENFSHHPKIPSSASIQGSSKIDVLPVMNGEMDANKDLSVGESDQLNFNDYFVPRLEVAPTVVSVDKVTATKRSSRELKARKHKKKNDILSEGTSPELLNLLKPNEEQGNNNNKRLEGKSADVQLKFLSIDKRNETISSLNENSSIVSAIGVKAPSSHDANVHSGPEEATTYNAVQISGARKLASSSSHETLSGQAPATSSSTLQNSRKLIQANKNGIAHQSNSSSSPASARKSTFTSSSKKQVSVMSSQPNKISEEHHSHLNSSPVTAKRASARSGSISKDSSKLIHQNKKNQEHLTRLGSSELTANRASHKGTGKAVSSKESEKNLLAMSGTLFKDNDSEIYEDEDGVNSDASTKTPSSSSCYSEGSPKRKSNENSKMDITKSIPAQDMSMNMILRRSKRFKEAKLTASQSQPLDFDSQLLDFVPDSQVGV